MVRQGEESDSTFYCRNRHDLLPYRSVVFTEKDGQHTLRHKDCCNIDIVDMLSTTSRAST